MNGFVYRWRVAPLVFAIGWASPQAARAADFDGGKVLSELSGMLRQTYFDPAAGGAAADKLESEAANLEGQSDRAAFAGAVTALLQSVTHDKHLKLLDKPDTVPESAASPQAAAEMEKARNYGIAAVSILPGNIGCLKLSGFARFTPDTAQRFAWAFDLLAGTYGLVIDVTHSRGGDPATEANLVGYVMGPDVPLDTVYPRKGDQMPIVTPKTYSGPPYGGVRPVAVAVSGKTFSAAEALPYDLQALKRARIVGEQTRGGANPGRFTPISDGFIAFVPEAHVVNALTHGNWEGTGVAPDKTATADGAVDAARIELIEKLLADEKDPVRRSILTSGLWSAETRP